jgi:hypothetical protein
MVATIDDEYIGRLLEFVVIPSPLSDVGLTVLYKLEIL